MYPEATWIPNPVPLDDPDYRPRGEYNHRYEIFVGQSPTRKDLKNTAEFRDVMERLTPQNPRLRARIIENTPHRDCLRLKKSCDIFFDHMQGYYGVSSLEALSQGVPVIAGLDDWNLEQIKETTGAPDAPWVIARNRDQLRQKLTGLIEDRAARQETGLTARAWMEKHWTEKRWAEMLVRFYEAA